MQANSFTNQLHIHLQAPCLPNERQLGELQCFPGSLKSTRAGRQEGISVPLSSHFWIHLLQLLSSVSKKAELNNISTKILILIN